jgi:hypothetical protein
VIPIRGELMRIILAATVLIASVSAVGAEDKAPVGTFESITKSAKDMLPSIAITPVCVFTIDA